LSFPYSSNPVAPLKLVKYNGNTRLIFGENTKTRIAAFGRMPEMKLNVLNKQSLVLGIVYKAF